jgi:hypothetical protein
MARGTTLGELVDMLRAEIGDSTNPALGTEFVPALKQKLRRWQEALNLDNNWPHMFSRSDKVIEAGQRYADIPAGIDMERLTKAQVQWNDSWFDLEHGIRGEDFGVYDSDLDERMDPIQRWQILDVEGDLQFEVWPVPATEATIRFEGYRRLGALVSDDDTADLDDNLIVLFAAAEILTRKGAKDADAMQNAANAHLAALKRRGGPGQKAQPIIMGQKQPRNSFGPREIRVAYVR